MAATKSRRARIPARWKMLGGQFYCPKCKHAAWVLRAVTLPVVGPVGATWPELREALTNAWAETTQCANWMATELYVRDVRREADDERLRPMPRTYLYPEARVLFSTLPAMTLSALENQVTRTYRAQRYELIWTRARSLATHRYPVPLPVASKGWSLHEEQGRWHVACRIGNRRWMLRLRGGPHMRYQRPILADIAAGRAEPGAMALLQVTAHEGDHRTEVAMRRRLMCKLVAWLPKKAPSTQQASSLRVHTDATRLIVVEREGAEPWVLYGDQIRRGLLAADTQRQRLVTDLKAERRRPKREREGMIDRLGRIAEHQRHCLTTWTHQVAAQVVGYAARQHVATVIYDDHERGYLPHFPWHRLADCLREKCEARSIEFVVACGRGATDVGESLAEPEDHEHE